MCNYFIVTTGYATEREEKHIAEAMHTTATLNLKKGLGSHSSLPFGDYDDVSLRKCVLIKS